MAEVLSQNEIEALLTAVSDGKVAATDPNSKSATEPDSKKYAKYDLFSQDKILKGKLVAFKGIHDRFANLFRFSLGHSLKKNIAVKVVNTEFVKLGEYVRTLGQPANLSIFENEELKAPMVLVAKPSFVYTLIDAYFGGAERPYHRQIPVNQFTAIEKDVVKRFVLKAIHDLEQSWKLNYPMKFQYQRSESNGEFLGSIGLGDAVAVVRFQVEVEALSGELDLIIQLSPLDAIAHNLSVNITGQVPGEEEAWKEHWLKELMDMDFEIRGILGQTEKSLTEIRQMKVGDVLVLGQDAVSPIPLLIQEVPKFKGMIGVFRGNNAVRLTKDLSKETEESNDGK